MATYPGAIKSFRALADEVGVVYDPNQTTTIYAKDTTDAYDEIAAIETELGINPSGASATVADRLSAIEAVQADHEQRIHAIEMVI